MDGARRAQIHKMAIIVIYFASGDAVMNLGDSHLHRWKYDWITRLRKGQRDEFVRVVNRWYADTFFFSFYAGLNAAMTSQKLEEEKKKTKI